MNKKDDSVSENISTLDKARVKRKKMIKNLNLNLQNQKNLSSKSTNAYSNEQDSLQSSKIKEPRFQDVSMLMHRAPKLKDINEIENIDPDMSRISQRSQNSKFSKSRISETIEHEISHRIPCLFLKAPVPTNLFVIYFHSNGEDLNDGSHLATHLQRTYSVKMTFFGEILIFLGECNCHGIPRIQYLWW